MKAMENLRQNIQSTKDIFQKVKDTVKEDSFFHKQGLQ
jgi:hypothetical protein